MTRAGLAVGLTGGLASGKSTLGRWLAEAGLPVTDSDSVVAELYQPGGAGARAVSELFGDGALNDKGAVDHAALAARVFSEPNARRALELAIHPLVRQRFQELRAGAEGVIVMEVPLLVESGMAEDFDLIVTVEADPEIRVRRAVERGLTEEEARRRVAAQAPEEARREVADLVIENDGDLAAFRRQAEELIARLEAHPQT